MAIRSQGKVTTMPLRAAVPNRITEDQSADIDLTRGHAEGYDPREFHVPASDTKGHSVREWFRLQPGHDRQIDIVLRAKKFPYRTKGDAIRHAVVRHLNWLATLEEIPSVMREVDAVMDLIRDEEIQQEFASLFDKLGEVISNHMAQGAVGEARRLVSRTLDHINGMPEGYWKGKYEQEVRRRFGHLLSEAPTAGLRPRDREGD